MRMEHNNNEQQKGYRKKEMNHNEIIIYIFTFLAYLLKSPIVNHCDVIQ